jgi:hypothetical protein
MEWILVEEEGFERLNRHEVDGILKWVLVDSYYQSLHYYIDYFKIDLLNEDKGLQMEMCFSDFRLDDITEWSKIISTWPFNLQNFCGEEEPARGFFLTLLTQFVIKGFQVIEEGSLLLEFDKGYKVRVEGDVEIADISWTLKISVDGVKAAAIMCSNNEISGMYAKRMADILKINK